MGIAQMDWEKVVIASTRIKKAEYLPKVERKQGVGCVIDDLSALQAGDEDDEMMELWWGDEAREGKEIRTYVHDLDDTEMMIGAKVPMIWYLRLLYRQKGGSRHLRMRWNLQLFSAREK